MKWVFYLLLLINVAYFGWEAWGLRSPAPSDAQPSTDLPPGARASSAPDEPYRLLLLREVAPGELRPRIPSHVRDENPSMARVLKPIAGTPTCYRLGPFTEPTRIEAARAWLKTQGTISARQRSERGETALHWVYLGPFGTHAKAGKQALRMKKDGVEDISVLSEGDMKNAISLGVFSKRSSLERRLRELRQKGYAPVVGTRYRTRKTPLLDVMLSAGAEFPEAAFGKKFPSLAVTVIDCS